MPLSRHREPPNRTGTIPLPLRSPEPPRAEK
jgi:hypothetical protein